MGSPRECPLPRPTARATALVFTLFTAGAVGGMLTGSMAAQRATDPYAPLDTLVRVMGLIETTWVDEIGTEELVSAAIDGMLDRLDPHSQWLPATTWRDLQRETHGSWTGIGIEVKLTDEGALVTRVIPGSPAARDGLAVGDLILSLDGRPLTADDLHDPAAAFLGPRGEPAALEVRRAGWEAPREVTTVRDEIRTPAVSDGMLADDVAWVRIALFQDGAAEEVDAAIARLRGEGARAVVLDLRDNPGGLLREAIDVADLFLDGDLIVRTWGRLPSERKRHDASPGALDLPLVVLVNGLSASASEIVAAALQDRERAVLVGTRTWGKGTVQSVFEHRDGSALKLTIGRYFTPSGAPVAPRDGRVPDVVVAWPGDASPRETLRERLGALELPDDERTELLALVDQLPNAEVRSARTPIDWEAPLSERLPRDPQLAAALDAAHEALGR